MYQGVYVCECARGRLLMTSVYFHFCVNVSAPPPSPFSCSFLANSLRFPLPRPIVSCVSFNYSFSQLRITRIFVLRFVSVCSCHHFSPLLLCGPFVLSSLFFFNEKQTNKQTIYKPLSMKRAFLEAFPSTIRRLEPAVAALF